MPGSTVTDFVHSRMLRRCEPPHLTQKPLPSAVPTGRRSIRARICTKNVTATASCRTNFRIRLPRNGDNSKLGRSGGRTRAKSRTKTVTALGFATVHDTCIEPQQFVHIKRYPPATRSLCTKNSTFNPASRVRTKNVTRQSVRHKEFAPGQLRSMACTQTGTLDESAHTQNVAFGDR